MGIQGPIFKRDLIIFTVEFIYFQSSTWGHNFIQRTRILTSSCLQNRNIIWLTHFSYISNCHFQIITLNIFDGSDSKLASKFGLHRHANNCFLLFSRNLCFHQKLSNKCLGWALRQTPLKKTFACSG